MMSVQQAEAQKFFNEWNESKDILILDTETTSLNYPEVIEIGVIDGQGNTIFHTLAKPKGEISLEAKQLHGITEEMVQDAPDWPSVWEKLYPILKGKTILTYGAFHEEAIGSSLLYYFDWISEEYRKYRELSFFCVMEKYADLRNHGVWVKLTEACDHRPTPQRALSDCRAVLEVVRKCYDPNFKESDYEKIKAYDEIEKISKRTRYISYQLKELAEEQSELLKQLKKLHMQYFFGESIKEAAPTVVDADRPIDISDDDLPF